ncbi:MAG TPA: ATP-binding cassette domain-containing protein, partial [Microlunatus sp.]|nr:ATP-binding cassette domain-containing protein [Microlunatus sp.]
IGPIGSPRPDQAVLRTPRPDQAVLRTAGLTVGAPGRAEPVVTGLELDLRRGDLLAVRGDSGSGKSTLLRALAGLHPAGGEVAVGGAPLPRRSRDLARVLAWQPQHAEQQLTRRTVEAEVLATSEAVHAGDPEALAAARCRADRLIEALGLDRLRGADPYQISGGEQRRVALAAAVAHRPELVLLDEPTVGQDRHTWAAVAGVIESLRADGAAVVVATHDTVLARGARTLDLARDDGSRPAGPPDHRLAPVLEPGAPPTARCNPVALLLIALGAAIGSFFVADWRVGLAVLGLTALLAPLAVRDVRATLARLVPVSLAALTVGWSALAFSDRGFLAPDAWPVAAAEVTRIGVLVVPGVLLIPSLPPSRLGDALAQRCRLPHRPVVAAAAGLLRLQQLLEVWRTMAEVRRVRGLEPGRSPVGRVRHVAGLTFALLVHALRSAQSMALSMDARGFAAARRRTFALPSPWRGIDWTCVGVATIFVATPILLGFVLR